MPFRVLLLFGSRSHRSEATGEIGGLDRPLNSGHRSLGRLANTGGLALLVLAVAGCATGVGPRAVRNERPDYNQEIVRSGDEQMLLNLVRLRYNDTPLFLELGTVVAQRNVGAALSASGNVVPGSSESANFGTGISYSESPTVTYTPLTGDEFATRMLTPIPMDSIMLFNQTGWDAEILLLVAVQRINNVFNAPSATGPTPPTRPDFETFHELAERLKRLQAAGLSGLNWEMRESEKEPPGRNPVFWVRDPADPNSLLAADVAAVRRLLELEPGRGEFRLTAFPFKRQPDDVGLRCRSLLGVLYFLATAVEVPPPHLESGAVMLTEDEDGRPFDWRRVTGEVLAIPSQKDRPSNAAVAVRYRGWWFYLRDDDARSKATFGMLNLLFSLQSASAKGKSPVLTLPVGR